jgi:nitrite reductase/ring-hydroxylating ferredoxin subunit
VSSPARVPLDVLDRRGRTVVETKAGPVAVFLVEGRAYAVANACPHEGNPLVEGDLGGSVLTCAYHLWRFDLESGACLHGDRPATTYPARLDGDAILVEVPGASKT